MRLTIHRSLTRHGDVDLEVARGTPLHEVVAAFPAACVWCGDVMLEQEHEAGEWPLVAGAILSAHPRHGAVRPHALHLAAIAGPDAGITIPLESATIIGSAPPSVMVRDDAVDARHATVSPANEGALRVKDDGSVNGTAVWSLRGDTLSWRGRRRAATIHVGDVIVIGHTLLEARREPVQADADAQRADGAPSLAPALRRVVSAARAATLTALADARAAITRLPGSWGTTRPRGAPLLEGCPDPTRAAGWSDPIAVFGPHAVELARAVILARGRRPPHPPPFDETWMSWLPAALPDDGRIRIATNSAATDSAATDSAATTEGEWRLCAETDGTSSSIGAVTRRGPVVRVHADTAEALARSRAGALPDPTLGTLHWGDAAALAPRHSGPPTTVEVVAGVRSDDPTLPWTISIGGSRLTLIAGAPGSGKTTLLATIAGALAIAMPPEDLALVILCGRTAGVLGPYMDLPHVRASKSRVRPGAALRVVNSLDHDAALTVIVADDIDALGRDGRTVAARLEEIAAQEDPWRVHVVMATRRPAAVLTPSLRASGGTTIALRTENDADALEMIGIGTAAGIPIGSPGRAFVRASGQVYGVQAAMPLADRSPRVRRCDAPTHEATSLAAAARVAAGPTRRVRPDRLGQKRPAS